ncbi:hypothetical protein EYW98_13020 [Escherichia coli]|nr:hypothetical protein [Escherichia coli]EGO8377893.1 hypothetical protein [Escherichia coli]
MGRLKCSGIRISYLVMLLLSIMDIKTNRDNARLIQWISNRVQELGDRYYPLNKHVKIRYTLWFRKASTCKVDRTLPLFGYSGRGIICSPLRHPFVNQA